MLPCYLYSLAAGRTRYHRDPSACVSLGSTVAWLALCLGMKEEKWQWI